MPISPKPENRKLPMKKRCAFTDNGVHYFYPEHGEIFCCDRCRKLDDKPPR